MWEFINKLFNSVKSNSTPSVKNSTHHSQQNNQDIHSQIKYEPSNHQFLNDEYEQEASSRKLTDLEIMIAKLCSYNGYIREEALRECSERYDIAFFPYILDRLSDYVPINRELAASHIKRWSMHEDFSKLCIDHFALIFILGTRRRIDQDSFQLLLSAISKNISYVSEVLSRKQGKLPRVLLKSIVEYQWLDESKLIQICRVARDQSVRHYWLEKILENSTDEELIKELKNNKFTDIKYKIFDILYERNVLEEHDLVELWNSKSIAIMDYAYFALRQQNFDFSSYFSKFPINQLSAPQSRIRAYQAIILKEDQKDFFKILEKLTSKTTFNSIVFYALKQEYLTLSTYLEYCEENKIQLELWYLLKLKKKSGLNWSLQELEKYIALMNAQISLEQYLELINQYNVWERFYWVVKQHHVIHTHEEKQMLENYIKENFDELKYAKYGTLWTDEQKLNLKKLLPHFLIDYSFLIHDEQTKNRLHSYLE